MKPLCYRMIENRKSLKGLFGCRTRGRLGLVMLAPTEHVVQGGEYSVFRKARESATLTGKNLL